MNKASSMPHCARLQDGHVSAVDCGGESFREVFDHAPFGMLIVDRDARILEANVSAERIFERPARAIRSLPCGEGLGCLNSRPAGCGKGPDCPDCPLRQALEGALTARRRSVDVHVCMPVQSKDQEATKLLVANVSPLACPDGRNGCALVMINDISDLYRRNEQLGRLSQAKDALLRVVTHDLGSPMTGTYSAVEELINSIEHIPRTQARDILETVRDSILRQIDLLKRLLDYARIQGDPRRAQIAPAPVMAIIQSATESLRPAARSKNVHLTMEIDGSSHFVQADGELLLCAVRNLVSNAVKFTAPGGAVTVGVRREGSRVLFKVQDSGVGMTPAQVETLFSTGYIPSTNGVCGEKGTGIGLPFVTAVLEAHHSRLRIDTQPGQGATFLFDLPVATLDA